MVYPKKVAKTKSTKHVCSECIEFIDAKDLFVAQVPNRDYSTIYCGKCIEELGITEFRPYHKVSEKKPKVEKAKTTKTKTKTEPKTGAKYTIDKKLDKVKSVKTTSNKLEELKKSDFIAPKTKKATILVSEKDAIVFANAIVTPSVPNEALKKAAKTYKEKTEETVKPKRKYTKKSTK